MKTHFLHKSRWLVVVLLVIMGASGAMAQGPGGLTSDATTQEVCIGTEPYAVIPGDAGNTFLWEITPGVAGTHWIITTPNGVSTDVQWLVDGIYTLTLTETDGELCSTTQQVIVTVNALPEATISYAGSPYCATGIATVTLTGQAGGTYSSTAGLVIDSNTGEVDLESSTPDTYTVTYNFGDGTCTNSTTTEITINELPEATISYAGSPYCATGVATVTLTGQAGGTYSSTAGLVIDPNTGEVDLEASTPDTYTVTYNFGDGTCTNSTTTEITINELPVITIDPIGPYCSNDEVITLTASPVGGTFSGPGVTGNQFYPTVAGPGSHVITYTYDDGNCIGTGSITIEVTPAPTTSPIWHD